MVMASAGLTRSSYSYFKSKSDLFAEMIDGFVREIREDHQFRSQVTVVRRGFCATICLAAKRTPAWET